MTARIAVEFQSTAGAHFEIGASVAKPWIVDAVESAPTGQLADWTLESQPDGQHSLAIRLREPLSPVRAVRLIIAAHRLFSPTLHKLTAGDLWPVRFRDITESKRLVSMRSAGAYTLKLHGGERLTRVRADSLNPAELALFTSPPREPLFECDDRMKGLEVSLVEAANSPGALAADQQTAKPATDPRRQPDVPTNDANSSGAAEAWAWNCRLESWYQADGTAGTLPPMKCRIADATIFVPCCPAWRTKISAAFGSTAIPSRVTSRRLTAESV